MKGFVVTPMRQEIELEAGGVYEGYITVVNPADAEEDFRYTASISPYSVSDEYDVDLETRSTMNQMVDWVKLEDASGVLKPNEDRKIKYTITVPADAPAGGQYVAIGVTEDLGDTLQNTQGTHIYDVMQLSSVIYAEIAGETERGGKIVSNKVPGFVTQLPAKIELVLENDGNVHERADIKMEVKNLLSGEVLYPREDDPEKIEEIIMPATIRNISRDIDVLGDLGVYQVTHNVEYLGESSNITQNIIVCPLWFMALVAATILAAIMTVVALVVRRKKQRRII